MVMFKDLSFVTWSINSLNGSSHQKMLINGWIWSATTLNIKVYLFSSSSFFFLNVQPMSYFCVKINEQFLKSWDQTVCQQEPCHSQSHLNLDSSPLKCTQQVIFSVCGCLKHWVAFQWVYILTSLQWYLHVICSSPSFDIFHTFTCDFRMNRDIAGARFLLEFSVRLRESVAFPDNKGMFQDAFGSNPLLCIPPKHCLNQRYTFPPLHCCCQFFILQVTLIYKTAQYHLRSHEDKPQRQLMLYYINGLPF